MLYSRDISLDRELDPACEKEFKAVCSETGFEAALRDFIDKAKPRPIASEKDDMDVEATARKQECDDAWAHVFKGMARVVCHPEPLAGHKLDADPNRFTRTKRVKGVKMSRPARSIAIDDDIRMLAAASLKLMGRTPSNKKEIKQRTLGVCNAVIYYMVEAVYH